MATSTRQAALLLLLFLPLLFVSSAAHHPPSTDRVKTMCDATPNRDLCYQSMSVLSPFAGSTTMLARASVSLCLDSAKAASNYLSGTAAQSGPLHSCARAMEGCVNLLQQALEQLDGLGSQPESAEAGQCAGKVHAWVGKVIADANACLGSLQNGQLHAGQVADIVSGMVTHTVQLTGNAQVFVGSMAPKI